MPAFSPENDQARVRMTKEVKSTTTPALIPSLLIKGKLAVALVESGSSVPLVSSNFLKSLGFSGALEVYKGKVFTVKSTSMPAEKAELLVQLEKSAGSKPFFYCRQ